MRRRETIRGYGQVFEGGGELQSLPDGPGRNWALPFPLQYRTIGYFLAAAVALWTLRHIPVLSLTVSWIKPLIAYTAVPVLVAWALTILEPHERSASRHVWALLRHHVTGRDWCLDHPLRATGALAVLDGPTAVAADLGMSELPYCQITGPAVVELRDALYCRAGGRASTYASPPGPGHGQPTGVGFVASRVELAAGERLVVKP
jgi:hypothetical protein